VVPLFVDQGSLISDLIEGISGLEAKVEALQEERVKDADRITQLENCRESMELKSSRKEMAEKVVTASKQFKILDVDFGKEVSDRKELLTAAKEKVASKIRMDKRARYDELVRSATVQVLARSTTKRKEQDSDQEIWTAPIVFAVEDRENRWELEDILRGSKVYPTFHWNREMVGPVKEMRASLKDRFPEDKHYIRIRPEEREGKWRIKADVKPRDSDGRFKLGATWDIPPMCAEVRKRNGQWVKPAWAQTQSPGSNAANVAGTAVTDMEQ
jgi:hypothetical protein